MLLNNPVNILLLTVKLKVSQCTLLNLVHNRSTVINLNPVKAVNRCLCLLSDNNRAKCLSLIPRKARPLNKAMPRKVNSHHSNPVNKLLHLAKCSTRHNNPVNKLLRRIKCNICLKAKPHRKAKFNTHRNNPVNKLLRRVKYNICHNSPDNQELLRANMHLNSPVNPELHRSNMPLNNPVSTLLLTVKFKASQCTPPNLVDNRLSIPRRKVSLILRKDRKCQLDTLHLNLVP
jgi:hypothetical protein